jgi:hypothetical protein
MFSEWEDKWWPKAMEKSTRAELPTFSPKAEAAE